MARGKGAGFRIVVIGDTAGATRNFKSLGSELERLGGKQRSVNDKLISSGRRASKAGAMMTRKLTLPIVALGGASVKSFADFDAAMAESVAIMGKLSPKLRKEMETTARKVGKTTIVSAKQAADGYFFLASAGLDAQASIKAMPAVAKFAQAGMFDMARATDLLTDAQSALGLTVRNNATKNLKGMVRVSDVFAKANVLANTSIEQISEAMTNKAGPALRALGKDVEEGSAVLAAFADQGLKGAGAGEALNIVLRDLQRAALKKKKAFKEAGVAVFDASGEMRNMGTIVGDLEKHLHGMSDEQRRAALTTLGFQDKSISNLVTLLGTSDAIKRYEKELRKAGGTTDTIAKSQLESLSSKLKVAKGRLTDAAITIGGQLAPHIESLAGFVSGLADKFGKLSQRQQRNILIAAGVVAALGPVLSILGRLVTVIGFVGKALAFLAANPIVLVIAALVLIGLIFWKFRERIVRGLTKIRDFFTSVFSFIKNALVTWVQFIIDKWLGAVEWILRGAAKAFGWVPGIGPKLKTAAKEFEKFRDSVNAKLEGIKDKQVKITFRADGRPMRNGKVVQGPFFKPGQFGSEPPKLHHGGVFRARRPGGEGLAILRDREEVLTPEQSRGRGGINVTIHTQGNPNPKELAAELDWFFRTSGVA